MTARTAMKRGLVVALVFAVNAGCLMTSTPEFTTEQHTAPFLVEATANPNPAQILFIESASSPGRQDFRANVISQDDPTGLFSVVYSSLYIDLDTGTPGELPYFAQIPGTFLAEPGTLTDTDRFVSVQWDLGDSRYAPPLGCHTATLVAAHTFDHATACPCPGDYSQITWQVLTCDPVTDPGSCNTLELSSCPWETTTPANNCAIAVGDAGTNCLSVDAGQ